MVSVCNEVASDKAVDQAKHGVLHGANGVKVPTMTNRMLRCVDGMWKIGAHDSKKSKHDTKSNSTARIGTKPYSLVPGVNRMASKSHKATQGSSIS